MKIPSTPCSRTLTRIPIVNYIPKYISKYPLSTLDRIQMRVPTTTTSTPKKSLSPDMVYAIRPYQISSATEESEIIHIIQRGYRDSDGWTNEHDLVRGQRITPQAFRREISDPEASLLLAVTKDTNEIVGCIKVTATTTVVCGELGEKMGYCGLFAVKPEVQGKGIGSYLMREAQKHCSDRGFNKIALEVFEGRHELIDWYKRLGFKYYLSPKSAENLIKQKGEELLREENFVCMMKELSI